MKLIYLFIISNTLCTCLNNSGNIIELSLDFISKTDYSSLTLTNTNFTRAENVLNDWNENYNTSRKYSIQIINQKFNRLPFNMRRIYHCLVFLENLGQINEIYNEILDQSLFWLNRPKYYLFILNVFNNTIKDINNVAKSFWKGSQILNYLIIGINEFHELQVLSYNPYQDLILNLSNRQQLTEDILFPNKLKNLYKYEINVAYLSIKGKEYTKGKWICNNDDCMNLFLFMKTLNATPIIQSYNEIKGDIVRQLLASQHDIKYGIIDIAFNRMFLKEYITTAPTFAVHQSKLITILPRYELISYLMSLYNIFDLYVWILVGVLSILFPIVKFLFVKYYTKKTFNFNIMFSWKLLLFMYLLHYLIFSNAFQGAIITALTTPQKPPVINTIDHLQSSGMDIYGLFDWTILLNSKLVPQFKCIYHFSEFSIKMTNLNKTPVAFMLDEGTVPVLIASSNKDIMNGFYIMNEAVGSTMSTYYMTRNSPYRDTIHQLILLKRCYGLDLSFGKVTSKYNAININKNHLFQQLSLKHLQGVFIILVVGLVLSVVVFLIEYSKEKLKRQFIK